MKILLALLLILASPAHAQEAYPSKSVRLIAAAAPGGNPDVLARMLAAAEAALHSPSEREVRDELQTIVELIEAVATAIRPAPPHLTTHE